MEDEVSRFGKWQSKKKRPSSVAGDWLGKLHTAKKTRTRLLRSRKRVTFATGLPAVRLLVIVNSETQPGHLFGSLNKRRIKHKTCRGFRDKTMHEVTTNAVHDTSFAHYVELPTGGSLNQQTQQLRNRVAGPKFFERTSPTRRISWSPTGCVRSWQWQWRSSSPQMIDGQTQKKCARTGWRWRINLSTRRVYREREFSACKSTGLLDGELPIAIQIGERIIRSSRLRRRRLAHGNNLSTTETPRRTGSRWLECVYEWLF